MDTEETATAAKEVKPTLHFQLLSLKIAELHVAVSYSRHLSYSKGSANPHPGQLREEIAGISSDRCPAHWNFLVKLAW